MAVWPNVLRKIAKVDLIEVQNIRHLNFAANEELFGCFSSSVCSTAIPKTTLEVKQISHLGKISPRWLIGGGAFEYHLIKDRVKFNATTLGWGIVGCPWRGDATFQLSYANLRVSREHDS